ncbi:hypothetical protein [Nostoc sp. KVJ20]|uniref:hypothetical protein n=1 Tax=Nostoc sp. KVJ20 TaxID=457944 RepID=UPI00114D1995|nr:hypothetical protein [Nostoc sp. KVJ20]
MFEDKLLFVFLCYLNQYSSDKPKTLVETAIHRVFKDKLSIPVNLTEPYCYLNATSFVNAIASQN